MNSSEQNKYDSNYFAIYPEKNQGELQIMRKLDKNLNYEFYPEIEWSRIGYYPPEGYDVLGAWHHSDLEAFIFLLKNSIDSEGNENLILYVIGTIEQTRYIRNKIIKLKERLRVEIEKTKIKQRLQDLHSTPSFKKLGRAIGVVAIIINIFSLALRKLPIPDPNHRFIESAYEILTMLIHISALSLLFLITIFYIVIIIKYLILFIKRI